MLALAVALLVPATASAAVVREYQLQFAPTEEADGALMIVSALVDPQESLPASVTVPVPAGAQVLWAGEILGGDPAADPARTVTVERVGDMDLYTLTLEQTYTAQLEIRLPKPDVSSSRVKAAVTWTNPGDEVLLNAAIVVEAAAKDVKTKPAVAGEIQTNSAGESLYPLTGKRLAKGESYDIEVQWKRGSATTTGGTSSALPLLLGALIAAVVALTSVLVVDRTRRRRAALAQGEGVDEDPEDADAGSDTDAASGDTADDWGSVDDWDDSER
jgi:hypothetical protein